MEVSPKFEPKAGSVNNYEVTKGLKRVPGLKRKDLAEAKKLGTLNSSVSILLSEQHIEFACVLEASKQQTPDRWIGFHFFGMLLNLQRCFSDPTKASSLASVFTMLHDNVTAPDDDPYTSPLLFIGDNTEKAYWQLSDTSGAILGFIPLNRSHAYHSLTGFPIVFLDGEKKTPPAVVIHSDIDRNALLPSRPVFDALYSQKLTVLSTDTPLKWSIFHSKTTDWKQKLKEKEVRRATGVTIAAHDVSFATTSRSVTLPLALLASGRKTRLSVAACDVQLRSAMEADDVPRGTLALDQLAAEIVSLNAVLSSGTTAIYNSFLEVSGSGLVEELPPAETSSCVASIEESPMKRVVVADALASPAAQMSVSGVVAPSASSTVSSTPTEKQTDFSGSVSASPSVSGSVASPVITSSVPVSAAAATTTTAEISAQTTQPRLLTPAELAKKKKLAAAAAAAAAAANVSDTTSSPSAQTPTYTSPAPSNGGISLGAKAAELANAVTSPSSQIRVSSSVPDVNMDALAAAIASALRHCDLSGPTPYVRILRNPL